MYQKLNPPISESWFLIFIVILSMVLNLFNTSLEAVLKLYLILQQTRSYAKVRQEVVKRIAYTLSLLFG